MNWLWLIPVGVVCLLVGCWLGMALEAYHQAVHEAAKNASWRE